MDKRITKTIPETINIKVSRVCETIHFCKNGKTVLSFVISQSIQLRELRQCKSVNKPVFPSHY
jgi:hypothetical protein